MTYFITFSCYGARLHGDDSGSVDPKHNIPGDSLLESNTSRALSERNRMPQAPYLLEAQRRTLVLESLRETCAHYEWTLLAAHVRTNHVQVVVEGSAIPERISNAMKSYASRRLNEADLDAPSCKRWSRHGSTRYLWKPEHVKKAIAYVMDQQGVPMAWYVNEHAYR